MLCKLSTSTGQKVRCRMLKCKVCGKKFIPRKDKKYEIKRRSENMMMDMFNRPVIYECFDCPRCGCQLVVNVRETETILEIKESEDKE